MRYHVEPQDVLQEAALVSVQRMERIRAENEGQWLALILAIATNLIRSKARRAIPVLQESPIPSPHGEGVAETREAPEDSEGAGSCAVTSTSFGWGPKRQPAPAEGRLALLLRDDLNLDWPEIAFILGRTVDAARMIRLREVRRLVRHIESGTVASGFTSHSRACGD